MKVLIVDDDGFVINGLKSMIDWEHLGVDEIMTAVDGAAAWELYNHHKPDLLITDVYMPRMNGLQLIKQIRESDMLLPIIILSGYDEFNYAKEAIQLNVAQYILKPAVFTEIEIVLKEVLNKRDVAEKKEQYFFGLRSQLEQSIPVLREQLLFDMLTAGLKISDIPGNRLQFLQMEEQVFSGGLVMSLIIHRETNKKTELEKDWQLYKFASYNIAQEIVKKSGNSYVLRYMEDRLPLLLYGTKEAACQRALEIGAEFIESVGAYLELNTNVGIGRWYESFTSYPLSHKESRDMLAMMEYEGHQKIFDSEASYDRLPQVWPAYSLDNFRQLSEALLRMDHDKVMRYWLDIERAITNEQGTSLKYMKTLCSSMINSLVLHIMEEDPAAMEWGQLVGFLDSIQTVSTQELLCKRIKILLNQLLEIVESIYNIGRQHTYIQHVKNVVAEQYPNNISFVQIADDLHLTRNYLSSLFKRVTGESFTNYLTLYRIEKAKVLMKTHRYMIYEVSSRVGYSDPAYFSRVFKNVTGISPTDYTLGKS